MSFNPSPFQQKSQNTGFQPTFNATQTTGAPQIKFGQSQPQQSQAPVFGQQTSQFPVFAKQTSTFPAFGQQTNQSPIQFNPTQQVSTQNQTTTNVQFKPLGQQQSVNQPPQPFKLPTGPTQDQNQIRSQEQSIEENELAKYTFKLNQMCSGESTAKNLFFGYLFNPYPENVLPSQYSEYARQYFNEMSKTIPHSHVQQLQKVTSEATGLLAYPVYSQDVLLDRAKYISQQRQNLDEMWKNLEIKNGEIEKEKHQIERVLIPKVQIKDVQILVKTIQVLLSLPNCQPFLCEIKSLIQSLQQIYRGDTKPLKDELQTLLKKISKQQQTSNQVNIDEKLQEFPEVLNDFLKIVISLQESCSQMTNQLNEMQ